MKVLQSEIAATLEAAIAQVNEAIWNLRKDNKIPVMLPEDITFSFEVADDDTDKLDVAVSEQNNPEVTVTETVDNPEVTVTDTTDNPKVTVTETVDNPEVTVTDTTDNPKITVRETVDNPEVKVTEETPEKNSRTTRTNGGQQTIVTNSGQDMTETYYYWTIYPSGS